MLVEMSLGPDTASQGLSCSWRPVQKLAKVSAVLKALCDGDLTNAIAELVELVYKRSVNVWVIGS